MGPQRKEQETSIQQNSSQEAHPVSSGQLLAHQSEPRKPRFSRRTLAIGGVGSPRRSLRRSTGRYPRQ